MNQLVAAIDLGTNTARLLIGSITADGRIETVLHKSLISRLGGGFSREKGIAPAAWKRTLAILDEFAGDLQEHGVAAVHAVATSAVREANNGREFVADVHGKTGIPLRVIDGVEEARLNLRGVLSGLDTVSDLFVFDIGGGSTEYLLARGKSAIFSLSLPLGVVHLTEGHGSVNAMDAIISRELVRLRMVLTEQGLLTAVGMAQLVGTAGTITTLAALHRQVPHHSSSMLHGTCLPHADVSALYQALVNRSSEERLAMPGLEKGREDLIIAGTLITLRTMELFAFGQCFVCETGLLQGALLARETAGESGDSYGASCPVSS